MLTCPNCHAQLEDDARFCDSCGTQIPASPSPAEETVYCPQCGQPTSSENPFCPNCGKSLKEEPENTNSGKKERSRGPSGKKSGKVFLFAGIGVAAVAVLVIAFIFFGKNSGGLPNYALYIKDKEIFYNGLSGKDSWQVTSRLADDGSFDNYDFASEANALGTFCTFSKDGSILFFPDRLSYSDDGFSLYYRKMNNSKEDAVKIDSNVLSYSVSDDASSITYEKNDTLYQYDRKKDDKQKIASDIVRYHVTDDGRTVLYMTDENALYLTVKGGERDKIDSDIASLNYVSDDLSTIFYIKDDSLYLKETGKDKEKISSDVENIIQAYDSGEVYYIKAESAEVSLMDYVDDDLRETDAAMQEPQSPAWNDPDYDTKREAYQAAYDEYRAKQNRDNLRNVLTEQKMEQTSYRLCYYDGEEESVITDAFTNHSYTYALDAPVITYTTYDPSDKIGVKLSEVENVYDISVLVTEALYSASERYIAIGANAFSFDQEDAINFHLSPDGKTLYYLDEVPEDKDYGELYRVSISSSGETESPELYDSDVYTDFFYFVNETMLLYFKDFKEGKGELYIDQEKIDFDVSVYNIDYDEDSSTVTYFTDYSNDRGYGTLKSYSKKNSEKIADDVNAYSVLPNGNVLYLYDYSQKYYHGDLYLWNTKDSEKIDDSVVCILPVH